MASCGTALSDAVAVASAPCTAQSEYSFATITEVPTPRQISRICSSPQCSSVLAAIRKAVPTECTVPSGDKSFALYKQILDPIQIVCSKGSIVVTGAPTMETNATETVTPATPASEAPTTTPPPPTSPTPSFSVSNATTAVPPSTPTSVASPLRNTRSSTLVVVVIASFMFVAYAL